MKPTSPRRPRRRPSPRRLTRTQALEARLLLSTTNVSFEGDQFRVNDFISGPQTIGAETQSVAMDQSGNFVVTYSGDGFGAQDSVFVRRYSSTGAPQGAPVVVNSTINGPLEHSSIGMSDSGAYVVVWEGRTDAERDGIVGQRFNAAGNPVGGEFVVNQTTSGIQGNPQVAMSDDGSFVVVWDGVGTGDTDGVFLRRFDANGNPMFNELRVNQTTSLTQSMPSVAVTDAGQILVTWTTTSVNGTGTNVMGRRFNLTGTALSDEFVVNFNTASDQQRSQVAAASDGRFIIAWESFSADGRSSNIFARTFTNAGVALAPEFQVSASSGTYQRYAKVSMADNGGAVVTWSRLSTDGARWDVQARFYGTNGSALSDVVPVTGPQSGDPRFSSVQMANNGMAVIAYAGDGAGDREGVYVQMIKAAIGPNQPPIIDEITDRTVGVGNAISIQIVANDPDGPRSEIAYQLDRDANTPAGASVDPITGVFTWTPGPTEVGTFEFTVLATDRGTPALSDSERFTITVTGTNVGPTQTVPGPQSATLNTDLVFSIANSNRISVADPDAGTNPVEMSLSVTNGRLTLATGFSGLTFSTGDGTSDTSMTFRGTLTAINAALDGLRFTPNAGFLGSAGLVVTTNDLGNTGSGGPRSVTDNVTITVATPNLPPVNLVPGAQNMTEDGTLIFSTGNGNTIGVSDPDAGSQPVRVTLAAANGALTLNSIAGLTFTTGDGTDDATMTFTGTISSINIALNSLQFKPTANFNGATTLTVTTNDQGNVGAGGAKTDTDVIAINVAAANDAPQNTVPGAQSINEQTTLTFSTANGNAISISDVDAGTGQMRITLAVDEGGVLTLPGTTGLTFVTGDGTNDSTMTFTGTLANVNAALNGLRFTPSPLERIGASVLTITTSDEGNTGGAAQADMDTVSITTLLVNAAPSFTKGENQSILETSSPTPAQIVVPNWATNINRGKPNEAAQTLTFLVTNDNAGLFDAAPAISAAGQLTYTPKQFAFGSATVTVRLRDNGGTANGGVDTSPEQTFTITITPVNQAPSFTKGADITVAIDSGLSTTPNWATNISAGPPNEQSTQTLNFIVTATNTALFAIQPAISPAGTLTFTPAAGATGTTTVTVRLRDNGGTTNGGVDTSTDQTFTISILPNNQPPVNSVPGTQSALEATPLVFSTANGNLISIADADAGTNTMRVSLTVTNGVLTLSQTTGLTFVTGDGTGDGAMTFTGTITAINAALAGMSYTSNSGFLSTDTLTLVTNDLGNTGAGGEKTDTDLVQINVQAVNDPPVNTVPSAQSTDEDVPLVFSVANNNRIAVSDSDAGTSPLKVTLSVTNGTLSLAGITGLTFSTGTGTDDAQMVFTGSQTDINAALNGLTFTPTDNYHGPAVLTLVTDDQGSTGAGGAKTDTDTVNITVNDVNDPPLNMVPGEQSTPAGTPLVFRLGIGNPLLVMDPDVGTSPMQVTLSVTSGTLSLSTIAGLSFTVGDGTDDVTMTFTGTLAAVDAALEAATFTPANGFEGDVTLTMTSNDLGATGPGGPKMDTDTVLIRVIPANDPPVNTVPGAQTTNEDANLIFTSTAGRGLSIADPDVAGDDLRVTLGVTAGTLSLGGVTGLTFATGDGTDDGTMTFTGTLAAINAALATVIFKPVANSTETVTLTLSTDDLGNNGAGGAKTDTDTVEITLLARNDAPVNSVPTEQQIVLRDTPFAFDTPSGNRVSVSDVDAASGELRVTLAVTHGTASLSGVTGLTFVTGDGTNDATMTFTGTQAAINAALDGLGFTPESGYEGAASLVITTNDQGNTGGGGALEDMDTISLDVQPLNDPPVNTVPPEQAVDEDTNLVFSTAGGNGISVADPDVGTTDVRMTLAATNGVLTLSGTTGLAFTVGDGTADATLTFTGSLVNVNAALDGLIFRPAADFNGAATLTVTTNDLGHTGFGGAKEDSDVINITVDPVNDAPVNTVPATPSVAEGGVLTFSTANSNAISIADVDLGANPLTVTLSATQGVLSLSGVNGLTFTAGDGAADATMTFSGLLADVNVALAGMTFTPAADYTGPAQLTVSADDGGSTGSGGAKSDNDVVAINVTPVNDPPANTVPDGQATDEDTPLVFSVAGGNAISVADIDAGGGALRVTLTAAEGTVTLAGTAGLSFLQGDGTADGVVEFTGTAAAINAALDGLTFTPPADFTGLAGLAIATNDQGNSGAGGALEDADAVAITVNPVNDAPVHNVPGTQTTDEETALVFSTGGGNAISVTDVDAGSGMLRMTLSVEHGTLTLGSTASLTFSTGDGTADASMTFEGTRVAINAALNGLSYTPAANFAGGDVLTMMTDDLGNTGAGGAKTDSDTVDITVNPVNDAPEITAPGAQATLENVTKVFSTAGGNAISVADVDADPDGVQLSLAVTNGTLTLASLAGLTFVTGDGTNDDAMSFTGTVAAINAALNGLIYNPDNAFVGTDMLVIAVTDLGHNGSGGVRTDAETVDINVGGVNDPPVNTVPGVQSPDEDATLVFSSASGNVISVADPDAGTNPIQVMLSVTNGALTLSGTTGLTFTAGDGTSDATMTFRGTLSNINAALNGLSFVPAQNFNGPATLSMMTDDLGNTGVGGSLTDSDPVTINVRAINDAPVNTVPAAAQSTPKDTNLTFSTAGGNAISVADLDVGTGELRVTLTAINGLLSLSGISGLTFTIGDGTGDATMTFRGLPAAMNAALNGLVFAPTAGFSGAASVTVATNDLGNTGDGGAQNDSDVVNIMVSDSQAPPILNSIGDKSVNVFQELTFQATSTNPAGGGLTYSLQLGAGFDPNNLPTITPDGLFSWIPFDAPNPPNNVFQVTVIVTSQVNSLTDSELINITVNKSNTPPSFPTPPVQPAIVGVPLSVQLQASDAEAPPQTITFSLAGGPVGNTATITPGGLFTWTPTAADVGQQVFNVTVTDNGNPVLSTTRQLTVNVAAAGSAPQIAFDLTDDTGTSATDNNSQLVDGAGTIVFSAASITAFTASFAGAPGAPVDILSELQGTGNTRTFVLDFGDYIMIRALQGFTNPNLVDGTYTLTLFVRDSNNLTTSLDVTFTLDTAAPAQPTFDLAPAFRNPDGTANAQTVTLVGTASPNVQVILNNATTVTAVGDGTFSIPNVVLNPSGVPTDLRIVSRDAAGNESPEALKQITFVQTLMSGALQGGGTIYAPQSFSISTSSTAVSNSTSGDTMAGFLAGDDPAREQAERMVRAWLAFLARQRQTDAALDQVLTDGPDWLEDFDF